MGLSERVWNYTGQFKEEIEMALDLGIRSGKSAAEMSRDERQYLRYPDKLFRRVRDEHGNLRLSKAAKAFHPGQGVYRSSYKNALRIAATETNMAYRTADYLRGQQLDFVVGIQVKLSGNHTLNGRPFVDICDELAGMYPKDFKFVGWHPSCRCYSVKVLKTMDEFLADERKLLNGEALTAESANTVRDMPPQFRQWVLDNRDRIAKARAKGTELYFIRDNKAYVDEILDRKPNALKIAQKRHSERTEAQIRDIRRRWTLRNAEIRHASRTPEQVEAIRKAWDDRVLDSQIKEVMAKARAVGNTVQSIAQSVANKYGAFCTPINYKTAESIKRKVLKAGFFPSDLMDIVRTTIIVDKNGIDDVINALEQRKEYFRTKKQKTNLGYSGVIVNMEFDNGMYAEIQINTPKIIYAKESPKIAKLLLGKDIWNSIREEIGLPGGLGHKYYEQYRTLNPKSREAKEILLKSLEYYKNFI